MKEYLLHEIGKIIVDEESYIQLDKKYYRALKNLNCFSHVHLFFSDKDCLKEQVAKIENFTTKKISITISTLNPGNYSLFDIKPYMPSEDIVEANSKPEETKSSEIAINQRESNYYIKELGLIRKISGVTFIEINDTLVIEGEYIKVLWWFSGFDKPLYRQVLECKPPYESLDKVGIFSTRSPVRPNPLAFTIVKIKEIKQNCLYITDIEAYDKTPCVGLLSYDFKSDVITDYQLPEYLKYWPKAISFKESLTIDLKKEKLDSSLHDIINKKQSQQLTKTNNEVDQITGILVKGARENNLKGISVEIPYNKITAVVGVSGSGKSSLVNDTIYTECRRKMEYLNHTRNILPKPNVDEITGCIPAVLIKQNPLRGNSMSTIGTYVNAYDYLRIIYATIGVVHCPDCLSEITLLSEDEIKRLINSLEDYELSSINGEKLPQKDLSRELYNTGAIQLTISDNNYILQTTNKCHHCNKTLFDLSPAVFSYLNPDSRCPKCNGLGEEIVVDEDKIVTDSSLSLLDGAIAFYGKLSSFMKMPNANWMKGQVFGLAKLLNVDLNTKYCDLPAEFKNALLNGDSREVSFSYKNEKNGRNGIITRPVEGLKSIISRCYSEASDPTSLSKYMKKVKCSSCDGERLDKVGRLVTVNNIRYPIAAQYTFDELNYFCNSLAKNLSESEFEKIKNSLLNLKEIIESAQKLGIGYLNLNRTTTNLSGGEAQRLKLLGASINHMSNILYIFDEPSKGLDKRDYEKVFQMIDGLKKTNNTIIMVEHNPDMIKSADNIIEIGPEAGNNGGIIVGEGTLAEMLQNTKTQISQYWDKDLGYKQKDDILKHDFIKLKSLNFNNLKNIDIQFPINAITCIYGVSGSGKSSLMTGEILPQMQNSTVFSEVIIVDQAPIGRNSKSIVATYIAIMDDIRTIFSSTSMAKEKHLEYEHFSFNNVRGQCENCKGDGRVEIKYLDNAYMTCPSCNGKRYKKEILSVLYKGLNISDVLDLSIETGLNFFKSHTNITAKLETLINVGLGYLKIGQVTSTLSGGEASRLKIASRLINGKKSNTNNLYLLDEPTTGLHFTDIENLTRLLGSLVEKKNTIIAIEHNTSFIKMSDWKIELGPKAGPDGGKVIYMGK